MRLEEAGESGCARRDRGLRRAGMFARKFDKNGFIA
jgi:hypothetical protein